MNIEESLLVRGVRALETIADCMQATRTELGHAATPSQDEQTDAEITEIVGRYIRDHQRKFTSIDYIGYDGTRPQIIDTISGVCVGRFKRSRSGVRSVAVPLAVFKVYASERGIDQSRLTKWIKRIGRTEAVRLQAKRGQRKWDEASETISAAMLHPLQTHRNVDRMRSIA